MKRVRGNRKAFAEFASRVRGGARPTGPTCGSGSPTPTRPSARRRCAELVRRVRPQRDDRARDDARRRSSARTPGPARSGSSGSRTSDTAAAYLDWRTCRPGSPEWNLPRGRRLPRDGRGRSSLEHGVETLPGVGPALSKKLAELGLRTVGDLVEHRPRRYERRGRRAPDRRSPRRGRGGDRRQIVRVVACGGRGAASRSSRRGSRTRAARSPRSGSTRPGSRRGSSRERACGCAASSKRNGFQVRSYDLGRRRGDGRLRAGLPGERGGARRSGCASSSRAALPTRARRAATRCPPS